MPILCFEADEVTLAGQHTLCLAGTGAYGKKKKKKDNNNNSSNKGLRF